VRYSTNIGDTGHGGALTREGDPKAPTDATNGAGRVEWRDAQRWLSCGRGCDNREVSPMTAREDAPPARTQLHGTRYGELLFATLEGDSITADVWTTFTLNDCPAALWDPIDAAALATERGATFGLKNGPRHWLIDELQRARSSRTSSSRSSPASRWCAWRRYRSTWPRWLERIPPEPCRPPQPFHLERWAEGVRTRR